MEREAAEQRCSIFSTLGVSILSALSSVTKPALCYVIDVYHIPLIASILSYPLCVKLGNKASTMLCDAVYDCLYSSLPLYHNRLNSLQYPFQAICSPFYRLLAFASWSRPSPVINYSLYCVPLTSSTSTLTLLLTHAGNK